jgi:CheY-like chemotaxis protein
VDAFGVDALETPAPESAPQASAAPRTSSAPMAAVRGDLTGVNVLIVDDERDAREILSIMLETWGARVTSAASAAEALRSASAHAPDVLVSDIGMPIEDGYSLMAKLRILCTERHLQIPAIAMTAYAASEDVARAIASGFDFHVAKPVEPLELRALIERALRRKSADVQAR